MDPNHADPSSVMQDPPAPDGDVAMADEDQSVRGEEQEPLEAVAADEGVLSQADEEHNVFVASPAVNQPPEVSENNLNV
jgi:hypothetical protein